MAIEPVSRITLFVRRQDGEEAMAALQRAGVVHPAPELLSQHASPKNLLQPVSAAWLEEELRREERRLEQIEFLLTHLQPLSGQRPKGRTPNAEKARNDLRPEVETIYQQLHDLLQEESRLLHELEVIRRREKTLDWLEGLRFPLNALGAFRWVNVFFLPLPEHEAEKVIPLIEGQVQKNGVLIQVSLPHHRRLIVVVVRQSGKEAFLHWLEQREVPFLNLDWCRGSVEQCRAELTRARAELQQQLARIRLAQQDVAFYFPFLQEEYLRSLNRRTRLEQLLRGRGTEHLWAYSGWVPSRKKETLKRALQRARIPFHLLAQEPSPGDEPPVEYTNPPLAEPFEFVTDLYARPRYWEMDPTPIMAPFFALFFGICLTDGGYGLLLALVAFWFLRRSEGLSRGARQLVRLLAISGVVTAIVGTLTGGFFGLPARQLPEPLNGLAGLVLLDPTRDQLAFLYFVLGLGMVHVGVGIGVAFLKLWRNGQRKAALLDQAPWLGILLAVVAMIAGQSLPAGQWLTPLGGWLLALSLLTLLLFAGRSSHNPFARLALGAFAVYRISGLMGDVLSYARLFALGMATGVIAGVVNIIAHMAMQVAGVGYALVAIILLVGHALNLAINALGGFIHTARLQYVEFFGKFFEGGGEPYQPLRMKTFSDVRDKIEKERP